MEYAGNMWQFFILALLFSLPHFPQERLHQGVPSGPWGHFDPLEGEGASAG
jgi:hypothetical protein